MTKKLHVKLNDKVIVISGNSKGTIGKVIGVSPKEDKVIVEGANIVKKHIRPRNAQQQGGIVEAPAAMYSSKVQLYCDKCKSATRPAQKIEGDKKTRVCTKCGAEL